MNIFIDIETIPKQPENETKAEIAKTIKAPAAMKKPETIQDWHNGAGKYEGVKEAAIDEAYRKTALDGTYGEVISCVVSNGADFASFNRNITDPEADLVKNIFIAINTLTRNQERQVAPYFIGHNVPFDLKFLWHRAVINSVKPGFALPFDGRHGKDYYDNMQAWAGFKGRISQDNLCKALGMEGKRKEVTGSNVWDFVKAGEIAKVSEYNKDDVNDVIDVYNRIKFISEGK